MHTTKMDDKNCHVKNKNKHENFVSNKKVSSKIKYFCCGKNMASLIKKSAMFAWQKSTLREKVVLVRRQKIAMPIFLYYFIKEFTMVC